MECQLSPVVPEKRTISKDVSLRLSQYGYSARGDRRGRVGLDVECWMCWLYGLQLNRSRTRDAIRDGQDVEIKSARVTEEFRIRRRQLRELASRGGVIAFVSYRVFRAGSMWHLRVEQIWAATARSLFRAVDWSDRWRTRWHEGLGWGTVADVGTRVLDRCLARADIGADVSP